MNIPEKIRIGAKDYTVVQNYCFKERSDRFAHCDNVRQEIVIMNEDGSGNKAHVQRVEEAFIHEALHAIDWVYNGAKLEEDTVSRLSEGIYQLIKQIIDGEGDGCKPQKIRLTAEVVE